MGWDCVEDLFLHWCAEALAVSLLEISDEVILLILLEDAELFVEDCTELVYFEWTLFIVKFFNEHVVPGFLVLGIAVPNLCICVGLLVQFSEMRLIVELQ